MTNNIPTKELQRAKKAIKNAVTVTAKSLKDTEEEKKGCSDYLNCCCRDQYPDDQEIVEIEEDTPSSELTPEMQRASLQGWNMMKNIIFPALPPIVQDLWVYLELLISIVAFALGLLDTFPISESHAYNYSYFGLATIGMILALIDGFIYFFQLGSCARCIRDCRRNSEETQSFHQLEEDDSSEGDQKKCCHLNEKWIERFNTWFEFGRNILSELLLYPLLIFDLFDFIIGVGYEPESHMDRVDFSLFMIGGFYLILSVYIMRILIVAGSMLSLNRIPNNKEATANESDTFILVRFCAHILGQIAVHLMIVLVIGTKIYNENQPIMENGQNIMLEAMLNKSLVDGGNGSQEESMKASPFLITAIVLGWVIPLAGVFVFFVVNYYWMKEFSIGFWLNMISLLQGESFAETVFGGNGLSVAKEKAVEFVEDTQYKKVKKQLQRFKTTPVLIKFFFPARVPITAISGLLYDILLLTFIVCLMLTYENGSVKLAVFTNDSKTFTAVFMISIITIVLANIHALILLNIILLLVIVIFAVAVAIAAFLSPLLLFVYFPTVGCLSFNLLFFDTGVLSKHEREGKASDRTNNGNDFVAEGEMDTLETSI